MTPHRYVTFVLADKILMVDATSFYTTRKTAFDVSNVNVHYTRPNRLKRIFTTTTTKF